MVLDIIRFLDRLLVCGNFNSPDFTQRDLLQFDGSNWVPACDGCLGGNMDSAAELIIYQDQLYVGGRFVYAGNSVGQGIMRWDGEEWYSLGLVGGGLQTINYSDQYSPSILKMLIRDGLLFIAGGFRFANHMTASGIVTWDGTDFCTLEGGSFTDACSGMDFYHDTLYVGTSPFADVGQGLVRYLGAYEVECSTLGVDEVPDAEAALRVAWDPAGSFTLLGLSDGPHELRVFDPQGRLVLRQHVHSLAGRSAVIPFSRAPCAIYPVMLDRRQVVKLAITH